MSIPLDGPEPVSGGFEETYSVQSHLGVRLEFINLSEKKIYGIIIILMNLILRGCSQDPSYQNSEKLIIYFPTLSSGILISTENFTSEIK